MIKNVNDVEYKGAVSFQKPVEQFNMAMLKESANQQLARGGMPSYRPVMHHEFFTYISQHIEDKIGDVTMSPIYVSGRHTTRVNFDGTAKDACPLSKLLIERCVVSITGNISTTLTLGESNGDGIIPTKLSPSVAISYNDKGISVAFGTKVWACSNMCIFGERSISTYGNRKVSFDDLRDLVITYINQIETNFAKDVEKIKALSKIELDITKQKILESEILEHALEQNIKNSKKELILNITQSNAMTREVLIKRKKKPELLTGWDMFQAGTENLKEDNMDMIIAHETLERFGNYMLDKLESQN